MADKLEFDEYYENATVVDNDSHQNPHALPITVNFSEEGVKNAYRIVFAMMSGRMSEKGWGDQEIAQTLSEQANLLFHFVRQYDLDPQDSNVTRVFHFYRLMISLDLNVEEIMDAEFFDAKSDKELFEKFNRFLHALTYQFCLDLGFNPKQLKVSSLAVNTFSEKKRSAIRDLSLLLQSKIGLLEAQRKAVLIHVTGLIRD